MLLPSLNPGIPFMKCLLSITVDDAASRFMLFLDETTICLSPGERPIDLMMEILCHVSFPKNAEAVLRPFQNVIKNGFSHVRGCAAPGALRMIRLDPHFHPEAVHRICVHIRPETETQYSRETVRLDEGPIMDLGFRELLLAPDRQGVTSVRIFRDRHHDSRDQELRRDQIASGSLMTGLCDALFSDADRVPREHLSKDLAILAGALASIGGHAFAPFGNKTDIEWAISAMSEQRNNFLANGYLVSERGWNPSCLLPGPRLDEAREAADPEIRAFGHYICPELAGLSPQLAQGILLEILEDQGIDRVQVNANLPKHPIQPDSNHSRLERERNAHRLLALVEARDSV